MCICLWKLRYRDIDLGGIFIINKLEMEPLPLSPHIVYEHVPNIPIALPIRITRKSAHFSNNFCDDLDEEDIEDLYDYHQRQDSCKWERIPGQKEHYLMSEKSAKVMFPKVFQQRSQSTSSDQDVVDTTTTSFQRIVLIVRILLSS